MIGARSARRSGITLTEILIAILIMGVGLISLATLFPLGLLRLREASRLGRSALEARVATDDTDARALLYKPSFRSTWYGVRDPFVQDTDTNGNWYSNNNPLGIGAIASGGSTYSYPHNNLSYDIGGDGLTINNLTSGLPFCYDPLWRSLSGVMPGAGLYDPTLVLDSRYATNYSYARNEARFGSGVFVGSTPPTPYINLDRDGQIASAHGLQRLTNFIPWIDPSFDSPAWLANPPQNPPAGTPHNLVFQYNFIFTNPFLTTSQSADVAGNVFANIDDIVFNPLNSNPAKNSPNDPNNSTNALMALGQRPSSLVPELVRAVPTDATGSPQNDYRFSWFFTGVQTDAGGNGGQFTGQIVVCENRPFSFDALPGSTTSFAPGGETVVEAIYGYGNNSKSVFLRWSSAVPDPQLRVGGWFADTTYERSVATYRTRTYDAATTSFSRPYAGCYWYQIAKRTDPTVDPTNSAYRSAVVTLTSPVRFTTAYTLDGNGSPSPAHVNVALIMPSVVNVFPRAFEVH